jgi:hypothetical protein
MKDFKEFQEKRHAGGRPLKFQTPEELQTAIDDYFRVCDERVIIKQVVQKGVIVPVPTPEPYSMAGLAEHLGIDRSTLLAYEREDQRPQFQGIVDRARARIHRENVTMALLGIHESRAAILNLASNFGYSQRTSVDIEDNRLVQVILDVLPAEIREGVLEALRLKLEALKPKQIVGPSAR